MKKVSPFVKFEIIPPLLKCLLDPLTSKYCRTWSSVINLWTDSRTCEKSPVVTKLLKACKINYFGEYDAVTLTTPYLKVLHGMVPQNS